MNKIFNKNNFLNFFSKLRIKYKKLRKIQKIFLKLIMKKGLNCIHHEFNFWKKISFYDKIKQMKNRIIKFVALKHINREIELNLKKYLLIFKQSNLLSDKRFITTYKNLSDVFINQIILGYRKSTLNNYE